VSEFDVLCVTCKRPMLTTATRDIMDELRAEVERLRADLYGLEHTIEGERGLSRMVKEMLTERAERASAIARELAEAVVEAEWQGEGGFWEEAACPFCGTNQESYKNPAEHDEKCPVRKARAALARAREAGLL